ncbi:hypothetical protein ACNKHQ_23755 [Shigella flexneri]
MKSDSVDLRLAACDGKLDEETSEWDYCASLGERLPRRLPWQLQYR